MSLFSRKGKPTKLDLIHQTPIEKLLEDSKFYYWDLAETKAVLSHCVSLEHFVRLHYMAFDAYLNPYNRVSEEILDVIFLNVLREFIKFIANDMASFEALEEVKKIYSYLGSPRKDIKNSDGREMLRNRLCLLWQDITSSLFVDLKANSNVKIDDGTEKGARNYDLIEKYNKLYSLCKKDDPVLFEIAYELNRCYSVE